MAAGVSDRFWTFAELVERTPQGARTHMIHTGGCHCGKVRFEVETDLKDISDCNCSICTKKGFLHLIVEPEKFRLLSGEENLATYKFNTGTARHTFCRTCGIHSFYVPRSDPGKIDVNVRCLDDVDIGMLAVRRFDGRNWEAARARGSG
jgi:hypothetical protein